MNSRSKNQAYANSNASSRPVVNDFDTIIKEATHDMPVHKKRFSSIIHTKPIWYISEAVGKTIARPNPLLFGAIVSFAVTIGIFLLSKNFGYSLSGFESIGAFFVGWTAGMIFDGISALFRHKK